MHRISNPVGIPAGFSIFIKSGPEPDLAGFCLVEATYNDTGHNDTSLIMTLSLARSLYILLIQFKSVTMSAFIVFNDTLIINQALISYISDEI